MSELEIDPTNSKSRRRNLQRKDGDRSELCTGEARAIVAGAWSPVTALRGATFEIPDTEH